MKSILFSFKIETVKFQIIDNTLIASTAFIKDELIEYCQKRLNEMGYTCYDYEKLVYVNKGDIMYIEGMAYEIQEHEYIDVSFR